MRDDILKAVTARCSATARRLALACAVVATLSPAVSSAADAYAAAFVAQTVPSQIEIFKAASVSVTMRNTGTAAWIANEGDVFLATQRPQDNYYWCIQDNPHGMYSGNRVLLPHDVLPGEDVTFAFVVKPLTCGFAATAPFQFRMLSQTHGTFGEETPAAAIIVSTAAEFVSQQVPHAAPAGATIGVKVAFKNTTDVTWKATNDYSLASTGPPANTSWGTASVPLPADVAPGATVTFAFNVTIPTVVGPYNFQWQMTGPGNAPFGQTSPATLVNVVAAGPPNYQGLWWAAPAGSESGWGIDLAHQGDVIFATWFTYDATGKGLWLAMVANLDLTGAYTGALLRSTGPPFTAVPFRPLEVTTVGVGTGALTFDAAGGGTFAYTLAGVTQKKTIVRQAFGPLPTCTFGIESDLTRAYNYQDLWWAAPAGAESGWGLSLAHEGDIVFGTWFTYDVDRTPMWLSFTAPKTAPATTNAYAGTLYRTTGPSFASVPFDPKQVVATPVGTASVVFTDGNSGTFAYSVNGVTGSKPITRQVFVSPGTVCQ
jgi:hypothetical protein